MSIQRKRVYDKPAKTDGRRFLVERLWPRGMKKEALQMDAWLKEAAPSDKLRRWFGHDPARWKGFQRRYRAELDAHAETWQPLLEAARNGDVTLLYSAHDTEHNNAAVLRAYLLERLDLRKST
ncbi:MAG TPA: DUF488 domain-containing protein [Verrucomicrobiae bacterium]|nr:DUF488 domain-containing protein [Verrucomicrobiae bacterium]